MYLMKGPLLSPGLKLEGQGLQPGPHGWTEAPDVQFLCLLLTKTRPPARSDPALACHLAEGGQPGCGLRGHTMGPAFLTEACPAPRALGCPAGSQTRRPCFGWGCSLADRVRRASGHSHLCSLPAHGPLTQGLGPPVPPPQSLWRFCSLCSPPKASETK